MPAKIHHGMGHLGLTFAMNEEIVEFGCMTQQPSQGSVIRSGYLKVSEK